MKFLFAATSAAIVALSAPALAEDVDACLVGTWSADLEDLAHIYAEQMSATSATVVGEVLMNIQADGAARIVVENLTFHVVMPNTPEMDVKLVGSTDYILTAVEGAFSATVDDFSYMAQADVMGTVMEIPISSADGLFGGALGEYGCTADGVSFENTGDTPKIPRHWTRVSE